MTRQRLTHALSAALCVGAVACTGTDSVLRPSALTSPEPNPATQQVAALGNDFRLRFDPVVGATGDATQPLSARLSAVAAETGIPLAAQGDSASLTMKGFFSAITDNGTTTVIYVWDVIDPDGNRLHRIQGQQPAPPGGGEGWNAVTDATMQAIADETMNQLVAWLATRTG